MSVILQSPKGHDLQINMWHWRPTMLVVRHALNLGDERFELLQVNGVGAAISDAEAAILARFLDDFLADFPPDGRLLIDGSITQEPKQYRAIVPGNMDDFYSASHDWLVRFRDFCRTSEGFMVV